MKKATRLFLFYILFFSTVLNAQKGKDGLFITSNTAIVNEYTSLVVNANAGNTTIYVANSDLNPHFRFSGPLSTGDLIMIIQMQGATINGKPDVSNNTISTPNDSSWGAILNYNNCGNYEFREVASVPNDTTIILSCPLHNNYTDTGIVQVVRVPRFSQLIVNINGIVTCDSWDSVTGGIVAIEDAGNTLINTGGMIEASDSGFRGGYLQNSNAILRGVTDFASNQPNNNGAYKGEGIAGYLKEYNRFGGSICRGAPANGGGGGDSWNAGGGGGANAGNVSGWINGYGIQNISNPNYITAWNLEDTWLSSFIGAGGGRGGYTWSSSGPSPLVYGPGYVGYNGDDRRSVGGLGGRPLDYSTGKLFLGGGGGAGSEDNNDGGYGGRGGGMVYLISYGTISGGGMIEANGQNGVTDSLAAGDGPGGAGAGGTIMVNSTGAISGITITANGGAGGGQKNTSPEGEGPGGGGGGGYIGVTNTVLEQVNGGANGTTTTFPAFPANGATSGSNGLTAIIPANADSAGFSYSDTVSCQPGDSVHFYGIAPLYSNGNITWSWTFTGGSPSISSVQTPVIYYATPGTYTVTLVVNSCAGIDTVKRVIHVSLINFSISIRYKDSICSSTVDSLIASALGAISFTWTGGVTCPSCAATSASPNVTTTYSLSVSNGECTKDTSITIHVFNPAASISKSKDTVCKGDSILLSGSGGTTYRWSNGKTTTTIWVKPDTVMTYTLVAIEGVCKDSANVTVHITPLTTASISQNDTICPFQTATLTATGAGGPLTYKWNTGATTSSINVTDSVDGTYTATVYGPCDSVKKVVSVIVIPLPKPVITGTTSKCKGDKDTLKVSGGTRYKWSNGSTSTSYITGGVFADSTITVVAYNSLGCSDTMKVTLTTKAPPGGTVTYTTACANSPIIVEADPTGGGPYTYLWKPGGQTTDTINVSISSSTTYTVTISNGCSFVTKVTVTPATANITACCNDTITSGHDTILTASGSKIKTYQWQPSAGVICLDPSCDSVKVSPAETTTYTVTGTDSLGCQEDRIVTVYVENRCFNFTVPNVFTPNFPGPNGVNSEFYIKTENITNWSILIYDRWGKEMFKSSNPNVYWQGLTEGGSKAPDGVYYYLISGTCQNNTYKKDGFLQLIR